MGSAFAEWTWRTRHWALGPGTLPSPDESARHYHRQQIVDAVGGFQPFTSLLEIGCNTGANLYQLAGAYPDVSFYGMDINSRALAVGRKRFDELGIHRVKLTGGHADQLDLFHRADIDIILTDAVLMFVGPDKIERVLSEMRRVARRGIILNEYASPNPPARNYDGGRFVYDFWHLLPRVWPDCVLSAEKSTFKGGGWDEYGWLFTVQIRG